MIAAQPSLTLMRALRSHIKLGLSLLVCSGALACTCAAYDVDVRHLCGRLLRAVGLGQGNLAPKETIVAAGNELSVAAHTVTLSHVPPDALAQRLAWAGIYLKDGWIWFQGQTLENVVAEFNRYNERQLMIGDGATGRLRVGGKFRVTDLDGFVAALAVPHGVKAIPATLGGKTPGVTILVGGGSGSAYPQGPAPAAEDD